MVSETSKTNCLAKDYWDDESNCQRKDFITGQTTYWSFTCYHTHSHTNTHRQLKHTHSCINTEGPLWMLAALPETLWAQECVTGASNGTFSNCVCVCVCVAAEKICSVSPWMCLLCKFWSLTNKGRIQNASLPPYTVSLSCSLDQAAFCLLSLHEWHAVTCSYSVLFLFLDRELTRCDQEDRTACLSNSLNKYWSMHQ